MDTIITLDGRRQIAAGDLRIEYASFTDTHTFYEADVVSGSSDAAERIFFEACHLPYDQITFESDDSGFLMPFRGGKTELIGGKIMSGTGGKRLGRVRGSEKFAKESRNILSSSVKNFDMHNIIGSLNPLLEHSDFDVSHDILDFKITDRFPFEVGEIDTISMNDVESFHEDKRLSHVENFMYLPPTNVPGLATRKTTPLGKYPRLGQASLMDYEDLVDQLRGRESHTVTFSPTSEVNNIMAQFFEIGQNQLQKLDVIDFGEFTTGDEDYPNKHVFFVGKVFSDDRGSDTFVNLFVMVFE